MIVFEIIPSLYPLGGAENLVINISKKLSQKKDVKVYIVSLFNFDVSRIEKILKNIDVEIIQLGKKQGVDFKCARKLKKLINKIKPDVCHMHLNTFLTLFLSGCVHKQKNFYTFHTFVMKQNYGSKFKPNNLLLRYLLRTKRLFPVSISKLVTKSINEYFNISNIFLIENGIDIEYFSKDSSTSKYTFVSVGSFNDIKNNLYMIKCFEVLLRKYPNITYCVIGDGKNRKECIDYCQNKRIPNIYFPGFTNEVRDYLRESDCMLMASLWEGNPLVINEAISCGLWVIANSVGGIPDLINETNGCLCELGNNHSFCDAMDYFLNNRNKIQSTILCNSSKNRERVSDSIMIEKYLAIFGGNS